MPEQVVKAENILTDLLSYLGVPGASTAGGIFQSLQRKRAETAREIFLAQLQEGHRFLEEADEFEEYVSVVHRYFRAAQEGAAKRNLRLMAAVANGLICRRPTYADEFLRYADTLSTMTRGELILVSTMHRLWSEHLQTFAPDAELGQFREKVTAALVPEVFVGKEELDAVSWATTRTGLVLVLSGWGGVFFLPSPQLEKIVALAPVEEIARRCD